MLGIETLRACSKDMLMNQIDCGLKTSSALLFCMLSWFFFNEKCLGFFIKKKFLTSFGREGRHASELHCAEDFYATWILAVGGGETSGAPEDSPRDQWDPWATVDISCLQTMAHLQGPWWMWEVSFWLSLILVQSFVVKKSAICVLLCSLC